MLLHSTGLRHTLGTLKMNHSPYCAFAEFVYISLLTCIVLSDEWNLKPAFLGYDSLVFLREQSRYIYNQENRSYPTQNIVLFLGVVYILDIPIAFQALFCVTNKQMPHSRSKDCDSRLSSENDRSEISIFERNHEVTFFDFSNWIFNLKQRWKMMNGLKLVQQNKPTIYTRRHREHFNVHKTT